jgi:hypothetical protein
MKKKNILVLIFFTIILLLVLENPLISQINIYYNYTSISSTQPTTNDGLFIQGSVIISQNTLTYVNNTTYQPIGYKTSISIFNFSSLLILFIPLIIYLFFNKEKTDLIKTKKVYKKQKEKNSTGID